MAISEDSTNYGLRVFNASGERVFTSRRSIMRVVDYQAFEMADVTAEMPQKVFAGKANYAFCPINRQMRLVGGRYFVGTNPVYWTAWQSYFYGPQGNDLVGIPLCVYFGDPITPITEFRYGQMMFLDVTGM
ncbi:MAG: hypothetical protein LBF91_01085 [Azoarcus sp.]|nr:hypothetical protein [Azoarcus sp.]